MKPVVTADEMRAAERATIHDLGLPALVLMESAGRAVAVAAERMLGTARGQIAVVCGPGNNGGDGYVCARALRDRGHDAVVYLAAARDAVKGDADTHLKIWEAAHRPAVSIATPTELGAHAGAIAGAALVIDALFGIGLGRAVTGHHAEIIAIINRATHRLAVDIPSGLDTDTGVAHGAAVHATATVTMGALKVALASAPGFAACGEVEVAEVGIAVPASGAPAALVEVRDVRGWLPHPAVLDHKGKRGHVVIIGGSPGMRGAGRLSSAAALRAGAGLCTLACRAGTSEVVAPDSVMVRELRDAALGDLLKGKSAIVIGSGLGQAEPAAAWAAAVLASGIPAVLDADALNLYAGKASELAGAKGPLVLTPHPGEAARLLGTTVAAIEGDRLAAARALAAATHAIVVLKGARTIVCEGEHCAINPSGGSELATGGSGDVLGGVIGALLAQKLAPGDAARAGVYVHGAAGDRLVAMHGTRGVMSSDLPDAVAQVIRDLGKT